MQSDGENKVTMFMSSSTDGTVKVWSLDVSFIQFNLFFIALLNGLSVSTALCALI